MKISIQSLLPGAVDRLVSAGIPLDEVIEVEVLSLSSRNDGGIVCPVGNRDLLLVCTNVSEVTA